MKKFALIICNLSFILFLLPSPALAATLSLSPTSGTFGRTCNFSVDVLIDTQGVETDGADVILLFDTSQLTATSIVNGSIYSDFPGNTINNSTGKVSIYALAPSTKGFNGKGTVATVNFTTGASASASANLKFDFDPNNPTKTTDSNVIAKSDLKDSLRSVTNGLYTLDSNSTSCKTTVKTMVAPKGGATTTSLPNSGIWEPTIVVGGLGVLFTSFGLLGLKRFK